METLQSYFPDLSDKALAQFSQLLPLYSEWNLKINVISRKDLDALYVKHVLHSLAIAKFIDFKPGSRVLDAGTGGGFPGIPLAIMFPEVSFHLVDSIAKKIKVVQAIANNLGLDNVVAEQQRVEQLDSSYDFIVSRAVTNMSDFVNWVKDKFNTENKNELENGRCRNECHA